jgi:hypothetical protein
LVCLLPNQNAKSQAFSNTLNNIVILQQKIITKGWQFKGLNLANTFDNKITLMLEKIDHKKKKIDVKIEKSSSSNMEIYRKKETNFYFKVYSFFFED